MITAKRPLTDNDQVRLAQLENPALQDLLCLVLDLEKMDDHDEIVDQLQTIEAEILKNFVIQVGPVTYKPLLIEAYYYHPIKFPDKTVHASTGDPHAIERQQKNFAGLYIYRKNSRQKGMDVCLTDSDKYWFSILIKNAIVNGTDFGKQQQLVDTICDDCINRDHCECGKKCKYNNDIVLEKLEKSEPYHITFLPRVLNPKGDASGYEGDPLAAIPIEKLLDHEYTMPNDYRKEWQHSMHALFMNADQHAAKRAANESIGYELKSCWQRYIDRFEKERKWIK